MKIVKVLLFIAIFSWLFLIFNFSSQPAAESLTSSGKFVNSIVTVIVPQFSEMTPEQKEGVIANLQNTIRKIAHLFLYFILGFFCMIFLMQFRLNTKFQILMAAAFSLICAIFDEIHQSYVPGRGPLISDVGIDAIGAILGIFVLTMFCSLRNKRNKQLPNGIKNSRDKFN